MKNEKEIEVKSALHRLHSRFLPYNWDLNIYRGCTHNCRYCYALYSHKYLENDDFFQSIYVKKNIVQLLEKELSARNWKNEVVNLGGVTDSYQAIEAKYELMPQILKLFIKYKTPLIISTKSDLILRDFDLLNELAALTYVNVALTITAADPQLQAKIEPGAPNSQRRFAVLEAFKNTKVNTGLHLMPILPYLTDTEENLSEILKQAANAKVNYVLNGQLNLRGETRYHYLAFLKENYPELLPKYLQLYKNTTIRNRYKENLSILLNRLKKQYHLSGNYRKNLPLKNKEISQLSLF